MAVGVLAVSAAAIVIRLADAPPLAVAFWRNALGMLVLLPFALYRRDAFSASPGSLDQGRLRDGVGGAFWVLDLLSQLHERCGERSAGMHPASLRGDTGIPRLPGETSALSFLGILLALVGTAVIASDGSVVSATFFGKALALVGAITVAVYVFIGRSLRITGMGVLPYSIVVYASASATLLPAALFAGAPL